MVIYKIYRGAEQELGGWETGSEPPVQPPTSGANSSTSWMWASPTERGEPKESAEALLRHLNTPIHFESVTTDRIRPLPVLIEIGMVFPKAIILIPTV